MQYKDSELDRLIPLPRLRMLPRRKSRGYRGDGGVVMEVLIVVVMERKEGKKGQDKGSNTPQAGGVDPTKWRAPGIRFQVVLVMAAASLRRASHGVRKPRRRATSPRPRQMEDKAATPSRKVDSHCTTNIRLMYRQRGVVTYTSATPPDKCIASSLFWVSSGSDHYDATGRRHHHRLPLSCGLLPRGVPRSATKGADHFITRRASNHLDHQSSFVPRAVVLTRAGRCCQCRPATQAAPCSATREQHVLGYTI
ncbi:hypothetical protein E2C01_012633 [Portunus trituberculatus]|uniref:Uncharacterized protein n=1 Tax=Portunus trituberculatus TaxID=210409 RepID=A0A5B7DF46_PORTR|nr:hypothetical protein [Portunus trituberculatus]